MKKVEFAYPNPPKVFIVTRCGHCGGDHQVLFENTEPEIIKEKEFNLIGDCPMTGREIYARVTDD